MYQVLVNLFLKKSKSILQYSVYIIFIISLIYSYIFNINFKSKYTNENKIYGYITNYIIDGNKLSLDIKTEEKLLCNYFFNSLEEKEEFRKKYKLGDYILIEGNLSSINKNTVFNTFNYKEYLKYERIDYIFNINKIDKIKSNNKIRYKIKNFIIERIEKNINKDYLYTFVLGNSKYIDSNVMDSYRINGISHLFSVSGMHISLLTMIILKIFDRFKFKDIIVIFVVILYMFLTDFSPSILRSGIFFILLLFKKKFNLNMTNSLLMILLFSICVFIDPYIIYKIGFQYSFIISFFLIIFNDVISSTKNEIRKLFIISFISFISSLPITINNFYQVNFLSIILNIIFVPFLSLFIFPITIISIIIPIPYLNNLIDVFEYISLLFSKIDIFVITLCKIKVIYIIIYYIIIYYTMYSIKVKKYKNIIILILMIFIHFLIPYLNNNREVTFIDVGQGDSIFMKLPNNKGNILIDTGGQINYKKEEWKIRNNNYVLSDNTITYIKSLGINRLDYLIITHGDYDHMGEAINLVKNFKVEKVIFNCGKFNELEQDLISVLDKKKIPYYSCIKELSIDDSKLYFLNNSDYGNENDNSSVIYTELNNFKFLFMGDAGVEVEKDLIKKYNLQNIDVLKVGHHGSKTSSGKEFIDEVNPKYSIISVGKNSKYGHPNKEVLNVLENSKIYRTDENGSIMFKIKNNKLQIETCTP